MKVSPTVVCSLAVHGYLTRIEAHLARLAAGHDPMGHLFSIERLARAAKADWWLDHERIEQDGERAERRPA